MKVRTGSATTNPVGSPRWRRALRVRKTHKGRGSAVSPAPPSGAVQRLQDPTHTESDFLTDLEKATKRVQPS